MSWSLLIQPLTKTPPFLPPPPSTTKLRIRTGSFNERINSGFCAFVSTRFCPSFLIITTLITQYLIVAPPSSFLGRGATDIATTQATVGAEPRRHYRGTFEAAVSGAER